MYIFLAYILEYICCQAPQHKFLLRGLMFIFFCCWSYISSPGERIPIIMTIIGGGGGGVAIVPFFMISMSIYILVYTKK